MMVSWAMVSTVLIVTNVLPVYTIVTRWLTVSIMMVVTLVTVLMTGMETEKIVPKNFVLFAIQPLPVSMTHVFVQLVNRELVYNAFKIKL